MENDKRLSGYVDDDFFMDFKRVACELGISQSKLVAMLLKMNFEMMKSGDYLRLCLTNMEVEESEDLTHRLTAILEKTRKK